MNISLSSKRTKDAFSRMSGSAAIFFFLMILLLPSGIHAQDATQAIGGVMAQPEQADVKALGFCPENCDQEEEIFQDGLTVEHFLKPPKLRPCCILGHGLRTQINDIAVPVKLDNVLYPNRLGQHSYQKRGADTEQNGLVYTCRGGIVDIAHVRDYSDWTAYLHERIRIVLGSGALIPIPSEAGKRFILIRPLGVKLTEEELDELALLLAERISFKLSIWHEIVTWYDHRSVAMFSERASSFSPEDMYSNLLGAKIGSLAIRSGREYNASVSQIIAERLYALVPLPKGHTKKTLDAVDGIWWDSSQMVPAMKLVTRRNLDVSDRIRPWLVSDSYSPYCGGRKEEAVTLEVPTVGPQKMLLENLYELRFYVDRKDVPKFVLPDNGRDWVSQRDFDWIIGNIRQGVKEEFGPYGDKNGMDVFDLKVEKKFSSDFDPDLPCGKADLDCSLTRNEEVHGVKIGKIKLAGGNMSGLMLGATLAEVATPGGLFNILRFDSVMTFNEFSYTLHIKAAESPVLMFCSMESEDGSGNTNVDYPFVNPFETKCVPNSMWGIKLDLLEMLYDSESSSYGFRPLEFGVVLNALGNGHTLGFLRRRLLFSIGFAPEIIDTSGGTGGRSEALAAYFSTIYERYMLDNRVYWRVFGGFRDLLTDAKAFNVEGGVRLQYNHLWSRRDFRGGDPLHSVVNFGIEFAINYWHDSLPSMPSMLKYVMIPNNKDFIPEDWHFAGHAIFYMETTIPKLGMF